MKVARLTRAALVITAAALLSCGDPPLSPVPPPQGSLIGSLLQATGLLHCTPLPTAMATQTVGPAGGVIKVGPHTDRKSTRLNSSHLGISYAVFCLKKKTEGTRGAPQRPTARLA